MKRVSLESIGSQYWWVCLFTLLSYIWYEHSTRIFSEEYKKLKGRLTELEATLAHQQPLQERLKLQIKSQDDPAWVEQVLIKELGVIPEDCVKVFFKNSK